MAIHRSLGKITTPLSHLPTWFFIIGYPMYWLELYTHSARDGVTSMLGWVMFAGVSLFSVFSVIGEGQSRFKRTSTFWASLDRLERLLWSIGFGIALVIIGIVVLASLKPVHLIQEFDCLQYHYTLPRQHLILGSFAHIPWAADDLFLLPMDFALAPFWFATVLPNKLPQLIIFFGLIGVAFRLTTALTDGRRPWVGPLAALAILGTHGFGIQMGTGMLDLAVAYLFLAALDSLQIGNWFLAGVEFTFFFYSKPLMPLQAIAAFGLLVSAFALARRNKWQIINPVIFVNGQQALVLFMVLSVVVAGPFMAKSVYYAATPFFPLAPGMMGDWAKIKSHPQSWQSLQAASHLWISVIKNNYGHGRGIVAFIKHWWLLAVPEQGVNNAFDYPLGLTYLLFISPFLFYSAKDTMQRKFGPLSVLALFIWALWWFSTQQTRFLYIPLLLIFIVTAARLERISKAFFLCLLVSLSLEAISLWGAHRYDMGRWGVEVLRDQDKRLLELNQRYLGHSFSNYIDWPSHDVAYAQFPIMVHKENLPHTIFFDR